MAKGGARGRFDDERIAVPAMPMPMAIICCILNIVLPGIGTMVGGFASLCCGNTRDMSTGEKICSCCVSIGIGLLQLLLVAFFLLGWIWSCIWGAAFIGVSVDWRHKESAGQGAVVITQPTTVLVTSGSGAVYPGHQQSGFNPYPGQMGYPGQVQYHVPSGMVSGTHPSMGQPPPAYGYMSQPPGYSVQAGAPMVVTPAVVISDNTISPPPAYPGT